MITPCGEIRRTVWLPKSLTTTLPSAPREIPQGIVRRASRAGPPSPSYPAIPVPAKVERVPSGWIRRTRALRGSVTRAPPSGSATTACGTIPAAVAGPPSPEKRASPFPAIVVMVPSGAIRRTRLLPWSATRIPPSDARVAQVGPLRRAAVAGPPSPAKPVRPVPAIAVPPAPTTLLTNATAMRPPDREPPQSAKSSALLPASTDTRPPVPTRRTRPVIDSATIRTPPRTIRTSVGPRSGYPAAGPRVGNASGPGMTCGISDRSPIRSPRPM